MKVKCFYCIIILIITIFINLNNIALPDGPYPADTVLSSNIKTVQLFRKGWEFSYPVLELRNDKYLILSFDDLDENSKTYNYTIVHCDADWTPSRISTSDYIDGFVQNPVSNYESSSGTYVSYIHYTIKIPNEHLAIKLSGNYVLLVYEDNNQDNPVLIKRFAVTENLVQIKVNTRRAVLPDFENTSQEVNFTVAHPSIQMDNPVQSVKVVVVKNTNWRSVVSGFIPTQITNDEIIYENDSKNIFPGGNEFRSFDIKDLKYQTSNIQSFAYIGNKVLVNLKPDKPRNLDGYAYYEDLNGKYLIQNKQGTNSNTDADYVQVHMSLALENPVNEGDVYVTGGFDEFTCYESSKLNYNANNKTYEKDILVKQGYYNYMYVLKPKGSNIVDEGYFEGNYYETENDYAIYVYYCPFGGLYDQLIGFKVVNSLKK